MSVLRKISPWEAIGLCQSSNSKAVQETVAGYFASSEDATNAIHELNGEGFRLIKPERPLRRAHRVYPGYIPADDVRRRKVS